MIITNIFCALDVWQVVDAPEILTVIGKIPYLSDFMNSLYECQYKSFFTAFGKYLHYIHLISIFLYFNCM